MNIWVLGLDTLVSVLFKRGTSEHQDIHSVDLSSIFISPLVDLMDILALAVPVKHWRRGKQAGALARSPRTPHTCTWIFLSVLTELQNEHAPVTFGIQLINVAMRNLCSVQKTNEENNYYTPGALCRPLLLNTLSPKQMLPIEMNMCKI